MAEKREYSRPSIDKMLVVNSEASINAVETFVKRTMASLYRLDVILFYIGSEEVAMQANEKIASLLSEKLGVFNTSIGKLENQASEAGIEEEIQYSQQISTEFKIYSPLCAQYLKLINHFERNTNLIDQLWLNGELSSNDRNKTVRKLDRHLQNVSRQIINASRNAMTLATNEGKEKEINDSVRELGLESDDTSTAETAEVVAA